VHGPDVVGREGRRELATSDETKLLLVEEDDRDRGIPARRLAQEPGDRQNGGHAAGVVVRAGAVGTGVEVRTHDDAWLGARDRGNDGVGVGARRGGVFLGEPSHHSELLEEIPTRDRALAGREARAGGEIGHDVGHERPHPR
jgi:hypothetical protein